MALAAVDEPEDDTPSGRCYDDYKKHMPEVNDDGMLLSKTSTATEVASDGKPNRQITGELKLRPTN